MKFEIDVSPEVMEKVRKVAEIREEKLGETVVFLVGTGSGRYLAATKWSKEHKKPSKPRAKKEPKAKLAPKAKKPAKASKVAKAKAPTVRKPKATAATTPAPTPAAATPAPATAAPSPLD